MYFGFNSTPNHNISLNVLNMQISIHWVHWPEAQSIQAISNHQVSIIFTIN